MLTFYSDDHHLHHGSCELMDGQLVPCFEKPQRADHILARVKERQLGEVHAPSDFGRAPLLRVHSAAYLDFFEGAWTRWQAEQGHGDLLPYTWPARTLSERLPSSLHGQLGYYSFDAGAPITAGTWQAAYSAAQVALSAQAAIAAGAQSAFALCRPPGHHAAGELMGGYCYLNNAAIAAQAFLDQGRTKVAILDVDYHHGNGSQSIFYARNDVLFTSIHGDPLAEFPFFLGYADELGEGAQAQVTTSTCRSPPAVAGRLGGQRWSRLVSASPSMAPRCWWCHWEWTPLRTTRSRSSSSTVRTT
jgi:acetoin utilization deacetylase AcuC-like enzyme